MDVLEAAESGDERALLLALREKCADAFDKTTSARDLATLSRRILELNRDLAALDAAAQAPKLRAVPSGDEPWSPKDDPP